MIDAIDAEISGRLVDACDLFAEAYDKYGEESPEVSVLRYGNSMTMIAH